MLHSFKPHCYKYLHVIHTTGLGHKITISDMYNFIIAIIVIEFKYAWYHDGK